MIPSLLVKGDLSCKSEWVVARSTCFLTVGTAILSYRERQRRSVFLKFSDNVVIRVHPWGAFRVLPYFSLLAYLFIYLFNYLFI